MKAWPAPRRVDAGLLRRWPLPPLRGDADKEARGSLLVVAGSLETPGAAWLAAVAALRAGCGKLAVATATSVAGGLAIALPEARVIGLPETKGGGLAVRGATRLGEVIQKVDAILIGPGLSGERSTCAIVSAVLTLAGSTPLILDAGAIDAARQLRRFVHAPLLTPHAGEMAHLTGLDKGALEDDPVRHARAAATRLNAIVALKGACTVVAAPDGTCWQHESLQVGLATSGSGDVLSGVIAGLACRGAALSQAAVWGIFLHAAAGRALARTTGPVGYLARELPAAILPALRRRSGAAG